MSSVRRLAMAAFAFALLCAMPMQALGANGASASKFGYSLKPSTTMPYTPCPPGGRAIQCNIIIDPPAVRKSGRFEFPGGPLLEGGGVMGGYDPADLQSAYGIPTTGGSGQTVAVVEAYGYAAAESDLAKYREEYGLTACTKANGCFKKVNQKGEEKNYPVEGGETENLWDLESALDADMVSAACAACHIIVVEATTQEPKDTAASAEEAAKLGATEISNSYGYPENNETFCPAKKGCAEYLSDYNHAGVPVTVSSGDSGPDNGVGAPSWPASSPNVIAVGGTSLNKASTTRGWSERVWAGSGSGCSLYETKPAWQFDSECAKRTDNDIAAVADPNTPVSMYTTPVYGGWLNVGGTSVSAPLIAAIEAHANASTRSAAAEAFYKHPGMLYDVTAGNGGAAGYDEPTGWGTPNGVPHLTGWFTRGVPNLATKLTAKGNVVSGTSCQLNFEAECFAVGHTTSAAGTEQPLMEFWNGFTWSLQKVELPLGAKSGGLSGVSCKSEFNFQPCSAVGHYINSAGVEVPLTEGWSGAGGQWRVESSPSPSEAKASSLSAVSCETPEKCMAVGRYITAGGVEQTLIEKWEGSWTISESVNPTGAKASSLAGVSCANIAGGMGCIAVGHYTNASGVEMTLAEQYAGKWTLKTTPNPTGAKASSLSGVSCNTMAICNSVGRYTSSGGVELTLAEHIPLGEATIQETPNPTGAKGSSLSGVVCFGTGASETCTAIGRYVNSGGTEVTLAEAYASSKWTIKETPNPTGAKGSSLIGLQCQSTSECDAVGSYHNSSGVEVTLVERYGGTWVVEETPNPKISTGAFSAVSCATSEVCTAVGHSFNDAGTELTLAEGWNGKEWSQQETPNPAGAKGSSLTGVSCASSTVCTAVGRYINSSGVEVTLAEEFASSKWTIKESPNPTGAKGTGLTGVSCASTTVCAAVGRYVNSSGVEVTLAEEFASSKWTIKESPNPTGAKGTGLTGVSCASTTVCAAVGRYVNSSGVEVTLAEEFASSKWTIKESPNPTGAKGTGLTGVSCASTTVCAAVGRYVNSGGVEVTLAEEFASSKWTIKESPNPTGAKGSVLSGVSCSSSEACRAVGHYISSLGAELTLAEAYAAGKWTVQETPSPEEAKSSLAGASCKSAEGCIVTGRFTLGGSEGALVEEHA